MTFIGSLIDAAVMYSSFEIKFLGTKDLIDMTLIDLATFRMTLEATKYG